VEVEVFYATDRARTGKPQPAQYFGSKRGTMQYGLCSVSIPRRHTRGELESPVWWKFEFKEDPAKHVVLLGRTTLEQSAFFERLRSTASEGDLLVFVHGFNVTFEDAVRRTAQMAHDLRFPGVPVTYSWPSRGAAKPLDYTADEATVEWTEPHLKQFLKDLRARAGSGRIHLIAHSMGNRALTKVLRSIAAESPPVVFNQVILAAPDIDAEVFEHDIAPAMLKAAQRVTLYASSDDEALAVSKTVHGYPRAGQSGAQLTLVRGVDTIDASGIDTSLLGHSYFANQLVEDIFALLRNGLPPDERRLDPREKQGLRYWALPR
jgi:esterase/lipase superfamily enzyme